MFNWDSNYDKAPLSANSVGDLARQIERGHGAGHLGSSSAAPAGVHLDRDVNAAVNLPVSAARHPHGV